VFGLHLYCIAVELRCAGVHLGLLPPHLRLGGIARRERPFLRRTLVLGRSLGSLPRMALALLREGLDVGRLELRLHRA